MSVSGLFVIICICAQLYTHFAHTQTHTHKVDKEEQWNSNWRLEVKY